MVCKSIGEMIGMAKAGADKIWKKGSGYHGRKAGITADGRNVYELSNPTGGAYRVITGGKPNCDCWFFVENFAAYGPKTTCKHHQSCLRHEQAAKAPRVETFCCENCGEESAEGDWLGEFAETFYCRVCLDAWQSKEG